MDSMTKMVLEARELSKNGELDEAIELLVKVNEVSGKLIRLLKIKQAQEEFK